jgi:hypothetical protein
MRHAEKSGDKIDPHLSLDGDARAAKLTVFIRSTFGIRQFRMAASISERSVRSIQTLGPLSAKVGVLVDALSDDQDYSAVASHVLFEPCYAEAGALIVVCWQHGNIQKMARALRAKVGSSPDPLDADVFNQPSFWAIWMTASRKAHADRAW